MSAGKKRIEWIDLLRTLAIFGVVLCHSTEGVYRLNADYISTISFLSKIFALTLFALGRLGVPLFLMISGYLLLDRNYDSEKTKRFWGKNWLHLLICTEIWFIIYDLFLWKFGGQELNLVYLLEDMLFIRKVNMSHVWYMPMILGMYLLFPFLANALNSMKIRNIRFPIVIFSMYAFGYPFLNIVLKVLDKEPIALQMSFGFSGGAYGVYFIFGYLVKKGVFKKLNSKILALISVFSFICVVIFQLWAYSYNYTYNVWYDCPFLMISSVALFELSSRIKKISCYRIIHFISYYSFAVYLIHNLIRYYILPKITVSDFRKPIQVVMIWFIVISTSIMLAWLLEHIPKVGKYILYIK